MTRVVQSFERHTYPSVQLTFMSIDEHSAFEVLVLSFSYPVHKMDEIVSRKLRPHYRRRSTASFTLDKSEMLNEPRNCLATKARKYLRLPHDLKSRL